MGGNFITRKAFADSRTEVFHFDLKHKGGANSASAKK
jgi:hypothetical protein